MFDLASYKWKGDETQRVPDILFPSTRFGQHILHRQRVVDLVRREVDNIVGLRLGQSLSVYLSGCHGCGKTCLLMLLARSFQDQGYEVYYFSSARLLIFEAARVFEALLKDRTTKVAVLVDDVDSNPDAVALFFLLQANNQNVVTIGAAVPRVVPFKSSARFTTDLSMKDLALEEDDEDFQQLVEYCVNLHVADPILTRKICAFLRQECGGHVCPTLAFIKYFLTHAEGKQALTSEETFRRYFYAERFASGGCYRHIRHRCFGGALGDSDALQRAMRVLRGKETQPDDIDYLMRLSWWEWDTNRFVSPWLVNLILSAVRPGVGAVGPGGKAEEVSLDDQRNDVTGLPLLRSRGQTIRATQPMGETMQMDDNDTNEGTRKRPATEEESVPSRKSRHTL